MNLTPQMSNRVVRLCEVFSAVENGITAKKAFNHGEIEWLQQIVCKKNKRYDNALAVLSLCGRAKMG